MSFVATLGVAPSAQAEPTECMHAVQQQQQTRSAPSTTSRALSRSVVVVLERDGGRIAGGFESASSGRSEVVASRGLRSVDVPAWSGSDAGWSALTSCVQGHFRSFDVVITDERPSAGPYVRVMIGGSPSMLGFGQWIAGVAPYGNRVIDDAVAFVFERSIGSQQDKCEAASHEIGHVLGLDHSTLCRDLMSYRECGPKRFVDEAATCGEFGRRDCGSGSSTQNSHQRLVSAVGLRTSSTPPRPEPSPTPPRPTTDPVTPPARPNPRPSPPSRPSPPRDRSDEAPQVMVASAPRRAPADSTYVISLKAADRDGIAKVELLWSDGRTVLRMRCGGTPRHLPISCWRRGSAYHFALLVGAGSRHFAVKVTDGRGHATVTRPRQVSFVRS